jgi:hypothetical protein
MRVKAPGEELVLAPRFDYNYPSPLSRVRRVPTVVKDLRVSLVGTGEKKSSY